MNGPSRKSSSIRYLSEQNPHVLAPENVRQAVIKLYGEPQLELSKNEPSFCINNGMISWISLSGQRNIVQVDISIMIPHIKYNTGVVI